MNELNRQLRALAKSVPQQASEELEQHLLKELRAHRRRRIYLMPAAAMLLLSLAFLVYRGSHWGLRNTVRNTNADNLQGFVPLPYGQSGVPLGQGIVLRMQLPVSELNSLGLPVPSGGKRERVRADVLVGQDGVARAVRFVHD